jgi:ribosomal protein S12 methylthiotransferase
MKRGGSGAIFLKMLEKARRIVPDLVSAPPSSSASPAKPTKTSRSSKTSSGSQNRLARRLPLLRRRRLPAFDLENKVPKRTIESRRKRLMKLQQRISAEKQSHWIGREFDLLVEGVSEEHDLLWQGRTLLHAPEIDGKVLINDFGTESDGTPRETLVPGTFYRCEITESHHYDVVARSGPQSLSASNPPGNRSC